MRGRYKTKHWSLIPEEEVPEGEPVLDSVWLMKRKMEIKTRRIYKRKERMYILGGQQEYGKNYTYTYSLVVTLFSIRLLLILPVNNQWHTLQVNFIPAYTREPIKQDLYMKVPNRIDTNTWNGKTHVLKLIRNFFNQAGRMCNKYLTDTLLTIGFKQLTIYYYVFFQGCSIFACYVDNSIFSGPWK